MQKNKVCILAAGRGTRLGEYTKDLNKAMLPIRGKAVISHIFENFPSDSEFVIALGYKGEILQNYIELAHPNLAVTFITVPDYDGPTSGPGASLLACIDELNLNPFYFVTCDTYWHKKVSDFPVNTNWMAVDFVAQEKVPLYCSVDIKKDKISNIVLKQSSSEEKKEVFTGLAYIKDTEIFWDSLKKSHLRLGEKQVIEPFEELMRRELLSVTYIDWTDTGLIESYQSELKKSGQYDFSKVNESLYFVAGKVIKYFGSDLDSQQRVFRASLNPKVFPEITDYRKNFYCYDYQPGNTLYEDTRPEVFHRLLDWLDRELWSNLSVDEKKFQETCDTFYRIKTFSRVSQFKTKYPNYDIKMINGEPVPDADEILGRVNWEELRSGTPSFIHGDLQPDNIIYDSNAERFVLLDWRQNFGGEVAFGDLYYDFAKLWGGLNLNYKLIKNNQFSYSESEGESFYVFPSHPHFAILSQQLEAMAAEKKLSINKIRLLVGLIYLNMSPLHNYPFDKMLFALGRKKVFESLDNEV